MSTPAKLIESRSFLSGHVFVDLWDASESRGSTYAPRFVVKTYGPGIRRPVTDLVTWRYDVALDSFQQICRGLA